MQERERDHRKFLNHLDNSQGAVFAVAQMLNKRGYSVTFPSSSKAEKHSDWKKHADNGDLFINQRVEVKQLSVEFSNMQNWPFGGDFIVCARHAFDRATPKPFVFVILSASMKNAAVVFGADYEKWDVKTRKDSRYENVVQEFYFSPVNLVRFFKMPTQ
jgi:hypothetical protein